MAESTGNYTFYPRFSEYVTLYRGVVRVWIADGTAEKPGVSGKLYAEYIDGLIEELGYVSDYDTARQYFADLGIELTYPEWVKLLSDTPANADKAKTNADLSDIYRKDAEAWAVGQRDGVDVPNSDIAHNNNAKHYSEVARSQADASSNSAATAYARMRRR